jgi:diaminohydroxyphosphoribosylaminopyrimidine deaminase/5-amino-6-(5-phosphoribosylamino)uracil reductase
MERALLVAERGRGRTSPNPNVGAVVVSDDDVVVGQGAHLIAGGLHAEPIALEEAGVRARGGTLYCTLEPCSHTGRTGPCVERITAAGVRRVVAAIRDPNPRVAGRGFTYLREHGIEVVEGVGGTSAARLHHPFFTWITERRPFVTAKIAASSDGFVARPAERIAITGDVANRFFQRQRAEVDAIAVGSETVLVDDPLLTARGAYRYRPLTRVIFDWRGRVPPTARVFGTLDAGPVIMMVTNEAFGERAGHFAGLTGRGVIIETMPDRGLAPALARLAARDVVSLLVEGGPQLQRAFAEAGLIDRMQLVRAPHALGYGVPAFAMPSAAAFTRPLGDDLLVEFDVHRAGGSNGAGRIE